MAQASNSVLLRYSLEREMKDPESSELLPNESKSDSESLFEVFPFLKISMVSEIHIQVQCVRDSELH